MKAKILVYALPALILTTIHFAQAQQQVNVPRIGVLINGSPSTHKYQIDPFRQGLHELGWVEGKTILIDYRYGHGKLDRLSELATELADLKVNCYLCKCHACNSSREEGHSDDPNRLYRCWRPYWEWTCRKPCEARS
jgi:hypothetical protein